MKKEAQSKRLEREHKQNRKEDKILKETRLKLDEAQQPLNRGNP